MKNATLIKISNALENPNIFTNHKYVYKDCERVRPTAFYDKPIPDVNFNISRKKVYLERTLTIISKLNRIRTADAGASTLMSLSCKTSWLNDICGSVKNTQRQIKYMVKLGLLSVYNNHYFISEIQPGAGCSKTYLYHYDNEVKIVEYCKDNNIKDNKYYNKNINKNINKYINKILNNNNNNNNTLVDTFAHFSSKNMKLRKHNMSVTEFESYLTDQLYKTYPEFKSYQDLAEEINNKYYNDDVQRQISFKPKFTWKDSEYVKKIGIRATNSLVSMKAKEDDNQRQEYCDKYGLNLHYDVKSSVPRITYWLNTGKWLPDSIDFYKRIYELYGDYSVSFEEMRPHLKNLHMRGYFDTESQLAKHVCAKAHIKDEDGSIKSTMLRLKQAVLKAEGGKLYDSEIFYYESIIYMNVLKDLLDKGFDVLQVYDAWYARHDDYNQEQFVNLINQSINKALCKVYNEIYNKKDNNNNNNINNIKDNIKDNNKEILLYSNNTLVDTFERKKDEQIYYSSQQKCDKANKDNTKYMYASYSIHGWYAVFKREVKYA